MGAVFRVPKQQLSAQILGVGAGGRAEPRFAFKLAKKTGARSAFKTHYGSLTRLGAKKLSKLLHEKIFIFCTIVPVCYSVITIFCIMLA
jgi:hypothetical protein